MPRCRHCSDEFDGKNAERYCSTICSFFSGIRDEDIEGAGCWPWQRRIETSGYPRLRHAGMDQAAQRVGWAITHAVEQFGLLYNICGDKTCVRPDHWSLENPRSYFIHPDRRRARR